MIAILELTNKTGYETVINFVMDEDKTSEMQVNDIAQNFSGIREAVLTMGMGNKRASQVIVNSYHASSNGSYLRHSRGDRR